MMQHHLKKIIKAYKSLKLIQNESTQTTIILIYKGGNKFSTNQLSEMIIRNVEGIAPMNPQDFVTYEAFYRLLAQIAIATYLQYQENQ